MPGRKVFTRETLSSADVQGYLQDQVVFRFASAAARDAAIPVAARANGMVAWSDADLRLDTVESGAWVPLRPGKTVTQVENGSFSFPIPQNAAPQTVTGLDFSLAYNSGRQVDFELTVPRVGMAAGVDAYVRMILADASGGSLDVLDGVHLGPNGGASWAPLKLRGRIASASGTPQRVMVQAWAGAAGCSLNAGPGAGAPLRLQWRIL